MILFREFVEGTHWTTYLAFFAFVAALWAGGRRVFRWGTGIAHGIDTIIDVSKELKPNGGSSIADKINQLHGRLDWFEQKIEENEVRSNERSTAIETEVHDLGTILREQQAQRIREASPQAGD
jgi:hypothetical protein